MFHVAIASQWRKSDDIPPQRYTTKTTSDAIKNGRDGLVIDGCQRGVEFDSIQSLFRLSLARSAGSGRPKGSGCSVICGPYLIVL